MGSCYITIFFSVDNEKDNDVCEAHCRLPSVPPRFRYRPLADVNARYYRRWMVTMVLETPNLDMPAPWRAIRLSMDFFTISGYHLS